MNGTFFAALLTTFAPAFGEVSRLACTALFRASWQAGASTLVIWGICRALPRLPASTRCWLWRLALLKFTVTLLWPLTAAVPLHVPSLPFKMNWSATTRVAEATGRDPQVASKAQGNQGGQGRAGASPVIQDAVSLPYRSVAVDDAAHKQTSQPTVSSKVAAAVVSGSAASPSSRSEQLANGLFAPLLAALPGFLFALYLVGVGYRAVRLTGGALRMRRFLRDCCRPLSDMSALNGDKGLTALCRYFRVEQPRLLTASGITASQLIAGVPPVILLPQEITDPKANNDARSLMLAHEIAHLRRRDLWWSGFAALTDTLFFFHPLVWLARREEELAREIACDALVLTATNASAAHYGALLVQVVSRGARPHMDKTFSSGDASIVSVGIAANEVVHLRRRLVALQSVHAKSTREYLRLMIAAVVIVAVLVIVPWRMVVAASPPSAQQTGRGYIINATGTGVIEGRVVIQPGGTPAANCSVDVTMAVLGPNVFYANNILTDVNGHYRIEHVPSGAYRLSARPFCLPSPLVPVPGAETVSVSVVDTSNESGSARPAVGKQVAQAPLLRLTRSSVTVFGRVVDAQTGQTLRDVSVGGGNPSSEMMDVNSRAQVRTDGSYVLHVAPGPLEIYVTGERRGHLAGRWVSPYRLPLPDPKTEGERIVNAARKHLPLSSWPFAATKRVTAPTHPGEVLEVNFRVNAEHIPPTADSFAPITGRVVNPSGKPVSGAPVYVTVSSTRNREPITELGETINLTADGEGMFRLEGIASRWAGATVTLRACDSRDEKQGLVSHTVQVVLPPHVGTAIPAQTLRLVPNLGASITGSAVDTAGHAIASAAVRLTAFGMGSDQILIERTVQTDKEGRYRFTDVWPGMSASVAFLEDGHSRRSIPINGERALSGGKQYDAPPLVLTKADLSVEGTFITESGMPVPNVGVTAIGGPGTYAHGISDAQGRFHLDGLEPGALRLYTEKNSHYYVATAGANKLRLVLK